MAHARNPFDPAPPRIGVRLVPWLSVMAGSMLTLWPYIATFPILPPCGLMMLLGWRLMRPEVFRIWAPLPLGLFDDLLSGQPLGSAMLTWTLCFFAIDMIDQRTVFRDFWQDWLLAGGSIGFCLLAGRYFASPFGAHVDTVLLLQAVISILLFPVAARICGWLDRRREGK